MIIAFRYIRYISNKFKYIRSEDFLFYLEYTGTDRSYKIEYFSQSNFTKINKKRIRLDIKKDQANEETRLYSLRFNTAVTKTVRIRKLCRFLTSRKAEIIRRGLKNIEKLEKLEE
jgi:hypothetical protein